MDLSEVTRYVIEGEAEAAEEWTLKALEEGMDPLVIVNQGLIPGMDVVGEKFQNREYYMPEMLVSARAMKMSMAHIKPLLAQSQSSSGLKAICGTVKGDLHDIGVNLVGMMLEGAGFEVIHLGPDNSPDKFLEAAEEKGAQVIILSALLTTTIKNMKATIDRAKELEMRDRVKIFVGGAPVTDDFAKEIGADGYAPDAGSAAKMIKQHLGVTSTT
ncbi:MAG: corrinoid protein [SAR202 cluster bacterium]|jgi:5-methyltetrahydrofolate--homocysteine methyltransferase|nr:corrinoid protein [SAR202 cluster bacterium]